MALLPVDDALKLLLDQVSPSKGELEVGLKAAFGATLSRDVFSAINLMILLVRKSLVIWAEWILVYLKKQLMS